MSEHDARYAAIEAGGTKFRVAVARGRNIVAHTTIPTTTPDQTLAATIDFIRGWGEVESTGIACFGPLDLDLSSPNYGSITDTPKRYWSNTPVLARVTADLGVPTAIDVDVGGAALGEMRWGAAQGLTDFVYITVGTGFGASLVIGGQVHHGMGHPEMGHIVLQRLEGDGMAFVHAGGTIIKKDLHAGETLRVDTGCLVAFAPSVSYDIQFIGGFKNALFGGEGVFLAQLIGPGPVYLQSLPFSRLADRIYAAARFQNRGESKGIAGMGGDLLGGILGGDKSY
jgi:predicted NBD/HSP70 family sugar kinase